MTLSTNRMQGMPSMRHLPLSVSLFLSLPDTPLTSHSNEIRTRLQGQLQLQL